jgi:type VI secretion system secreted protein VgrG
VAIRHDVPYRPAQVTPRPKVHGLESAIVTGPTDEEIHVDAWGRIKVHFYWDRENPLDDTSSCWLRVSQTGGLGNIIHPRVGQEVLVDFINGDPDRPIVVGRVYNEGLKPFYELPANKTRAVWRTKTYKATSGLSQDAEDLETGKPGANEIRFEDKTGEEELFIHAEKDLNTRIRHWETHKVGGNVDIWVGRNRSEEVKVDELIKIGGNRTESVELDEDLTVRNNRKREVFKDEEVKIGSNQTIKVGTDLMIEAGSKITLVCGGSKIEMTPGKIVISSVNIEVTASVELKTTSSAKTTITGGGMAEITAGMVKIN